MIKLTVQGHDKEEIFYFNEEQITLMQYLESDGFTRVYVGGVKDSFLVKETPEQIFPSGLKEPKELPKEKPKVVGHR